MDLTQKQTLTETGRQRVMYDTWHSCDKKSSQMATNATRLHASRVSTDLGMRLEMMVSSRSAA